MPRLTFRKSRIHFISVTIPEGPHPFPFRTRPLSPPGPMVLPGQLGGRVGRRRVNLPKPVKETSPAFCFSGSPPLSFLLRIGTAPFSGNCGRVKTREIKFSEEEK